MEQNFQEQAAGSDSHTLWGRAGAFDKAFCIAVFFEEGAADPLDLAHVLDCAREKDAVVHAFYIRAMDLTHYGLMDHLAPAGDMDAFVKYVAAQDMEQAQEVFSVLLAAEDVPCRLQVLYGRRSIEPWLKYLGRHKAGVRLFMHCR